LLISTGGNAQHDERKGGPEADDSGNWRTVTKWLAERPIGIDGYELIGEYPTNTKAEEACKTWSDSHPEILRLTRTREVKTGVRDVPPTTPKPKPEEPALTGPKGAIPKAASKGTITVKVYKLVNGKWVEQPDRKYETPNEYDTAVDYFQRVKAMRTWTATWNAPGWPKPKEFMEKKAYDPPDAASPEAKELRPYGGTLKSEPKPQAQAKIDVAGVWSGSKDSSTFRDQPHSIVFNKDGTFTGNDPSSGKWYIEGKEIHVEADTNPGNAYGIRFHYGFVQNGDSLSLLEDRSSYPFGDGYRGTRFDLTRQKK